MTRREQDEAEYKAEMVMKIRRIERHFSDHKPKISRVDMDSTRHHSTYAPFCPDISTHQSIDYSRVSDLAVKSYPGARNTEEALVFALKHTEMRVDNAIEFYSKAAHQYDQALYAADWIDHYLGGVDYLNRLCSTDEAP